MPRHLLVALLVIAVLPVATADAATRTPPGRVGTTITPFEGIGALKTGIRPARVRELLGRPDETLRVVGVLAGVDYKRRYGLRVLFDTQTAPAQQTVSSVTVYDKRFRTREGIRVGGTLTQLRRAYPVFNQERCGGTPSRRECLLRAPGVTEGQPGARTRFSFRGTRIASIQISD